MSRQFEVLVRRFPLRLSITICVVVTPLALLICGCRSDVTSSLPQQVTGASVESITSEDGLRLDARLFAGQSLTAADRLVILLHMYRSDQSSWFDFAREVQGRGDASALTLDFRGYGTSEGSKDVGRIDSDVRGALRFARERGYDSVILVGASMGGTAAIIVATEEPLAGVVTLSAPQRFLGLDAGSRVGDVRASLAVIAARRDRSGVESLDWFAKQANLAESHVFLIDGSAHGTELLLPDGVSEVRGHLFALFDEFWSR